MSKGIDPQKPEEAPTVPEVNLDDKGKPKAKGKPTTTPSPEEIEAQAGVLGKRLFGSPSESASAATPAAPPTDDDEPEVIPSSDEPTPEDQPTPSVPPAPSTPAPEPEPPAPKPKVNLPPPLQTSQPPPITPQPAPVPTQQQADALELTSMQKLQLEAADIMGENDPKHRGLASRIKKYWVAESDYIKQWKASHPGERFDPQSDEHDIFYSDNEPKFEKAEMDAAIAQLHANKGYERASKELKGEIDSLKSQIEMKDAQGDIQATTNQALTYMLKGAYPEFGAILGNADSMSVAHETKLFEKNPAMYEFLVEESQPLTVISAELQKLDRFKSKYPLNPSMVVTLDSGGTIFPHREIQQLAQSLDRYYSSLPPEQTARDGRRYVTAAQWSGAIQQIADSGQPKHVINSQLEQIAAQYWTVTYADIYGAAITKYTELAKKKIDRMKKLSGNAELSTQQPATPETPTTQEPSSNTPQPTPVTQQPSSRRKPAPSLATESDAQTTATPTEQQGVLTEKHVANKFFQ